MLESGLAEFLVKNLPEEILAARPEELYLEDFATIANMGAS